jgi:hypothetical protein
MRRRILRLLDALLMIALLGLVASLLLGNQLTISTAGPPTLTVATTYICPPPTSQTCSDTLATPGNTLTQSVTLTTHGPAVTVQTDPSRSCLFTARPTLCPSPGSAATLADLVGRTLTLTTTQPAARPLQPQITTTLLQDATNADQGQAVHIPLHYQLAVLPPGAN